MTAFAAVPEVRRGGTPQDELDVDVRLVDEDVSQEAVVAVRVVQARVPLQLDPLPRRRQTLEVLLRLARVALAVAELGRVDLEEPDAASALELEGVAVADPLYGCCARRRIWLLLPAAWQHDRRESEAERRGVVETTHDEATVGTVAARVHQAGG